LKDALPKYNVLCATPGVGLITAIAVETLAHLWNTFVGDKIWPLGSSAKSMIAATITA
jgi:hypothetical protein